MHILYQFTAKFGTIPTKSVKEDIHNGVSSEKTISWNPVYKRMLTEKIMDHQIDIL